MNSENFTYKIIVEEIKIILLMVKKLFFLCGKNIIIILIYNINTYKRHKDLIYYKVYIYNFNINWNSFFYKIN